MMVRMMMCKNCQWEKDNYHLTILLFIQVPGRLAKEKQSTLRFAESQPRAGKQNQSVAALFRKTPEEVVEGRHSKSPTQITLETCTKSKEEKKRTTMHIANFFYECGIPFNVANSRSFKIMIESIGQMGSGWKPPSSHELRVPLFEKARKETNKLKEKHQLAWKQYGCTLMLDGWTTRRNRYLINFLVNSPKGTFFLETVDASSESQDATMLAALLEKKIEGIGKDNVVQIVTDNGANYKAAGRLLEERIPTLFWTPCATHCLDLMLEDIGKLAEFKSKIASVRNVTTFIYRHDRLLNAMREQIGGKDLVRPGATRSTTSFLTLQSLYKNKNGLRTLFVCEDWNNSKLANTEAGKRVCDIVLSSRFWTAIEDCIKASHPLLIVLRIVNGDTTPTMPELSMAMLTAKKKLNESFASKPMLLAKLMSIVEGRWKDQMEVKLYGAALFLNPSKYFDLMENDIRYACEQRAMFNDVFEKMIIDLDLQVKISNQVDDYYNMRGNFGKQLAIKQQKTKTPLDWWNAFGGDSIELQSLAMRIISLCCSSSGCERNWSTFESIHTKRRNRLEHKRLNDLIYVQYNLKIANRFQKLHEEGSNLNPLILEEFQWNNEWVDGSDDAVHPGGDISWRLVDEVIGASNNLEGHNLFTRANVGEGTSAPTLSHSRRRNTSSFMIDEEEQNEEEDPFPNDDEDVDDDDNEGQGNMSDFFMDI
ncbi:uncharacterized protein LOC115996475 [Ipomoea triloba]|uniref:uncharacterized protein LOC115996475 n=1 Tax=Ipomoea triloba TaxID=35885 RepID=UPI00125CFD4C|nr:uncharacterized protein LOC115996475 [Ipomoea triloba]XP_031091573.1 uncharacterized protein LOC115996475 [Ipomoea triloba]XP_031091574.1 uncharacterized protein LOC115996475 [Ipomoea triloba]